MGHRRIGHQMHEVLRIVASNPGCSKKFVAEIISPHPTPKKNWSIGYEPVNRAIKAGLIRAERNGIAYKLYANEEIPYNLTTIEEN